MRLSARRRLMPLLLLSAAVTTLEVVAGFPRAGAQTTSATASISAPQRPPGKGLAQHPFLYCGEWDYIHPLQSMYLVQDGKVAWSYSMPLHVIKDGKQDISEFGDCTQLSNGNILFSMKIGAAEITPDKQIVWHYDAPPKTEVHSVQAIGKDRVLLMRNGDPATLLIINKISGRIEKQLTLPVAHSESPHGQFRRVRMTQAGTFLAAHMDMNKVSEYDSNGKEIWSIAALTPWAAVRLRNGNTLISGNQSGYVREVNSRGDTVWQITRDELDGFPLAVVQEADRMANGDTIICNWIAGETKPEDWPKSFQVLEVTPDKRVVWALKQWSDPYLGPASSIQLLDEPGTPEEFGLQR